MRYQANHNFTKRQFNESLQALNKAGTALDIARFSFDRVKLEINLDLLENIQTVSACRFASSYFQIESVGFKTSIVTESPTILPLDIIMFIPSNNRIVTETINFG